MSPKALGWTAAGLSLAAGGSFLLAIVFSVLAFTADSSTGGGGEGGFFSGITRALGGDGPAAAGFDGGRPVGLYFMTRFWIGTGSLEKSAWYFAPDGRVFENPERGFSDEALGAHQGQQGIATVEGEDLIVNWSNGTKTQSRLERDGDGFSWDGGIFVPVEPFADSSDLAGRWEGGDSLSFGGNFASTSRTLELREDGTFTWDSIAFLAGTTEESELSASASGGTSGTWELADYILRLTDSNGNVVTGVTFPYDDEETAVFPDRFFFRGTMYKKQ